MGKIHSAVNSGSHLTTTTTIDILPDFILTVDSHSYFTRGRSVEILYIDTHNLWPGDLT